MIKKETRKRLLFCPGVGAMSRAAAGGLGFRAAKSPHQKKRDILSAVSFLLWLPTGFVVCTPRIPQGRECEYKETAVGFLYTFSQGLCL